MKEIVQQIAMDFITKMMKNYEEKGIYELGAMAEDVLEMAKGAARELVSVFIEETDEALVRMKRERKYEGIKVQERKVSRTLLTSVGELTYKRTYYKTEEGMEYLIDRLLGVAAYERVERHVSARLTNESGRGSFGRSADIVTGGGVSRQTAWRKAMESGEVAVLPARVKETPERIHIFADEDHVHLQEGRGAVLPIVTVCSGKRRVSKGRNELIDKTHLCGYGLKAATYWEYVYGACSAKYDMSKVKEVFLYGDGAAWIERSSDVFPDAVRVLDAYHYEKRMKILSSGDVCVKFGAALSGAVLRKSREDFESIVARIVSGIEGTMTAGRERDRKGRCAESRRRQTI